MLSSKATTPSSPKGVRDFQTRLAEEGENIINIKFAEKIAQLDQLCMSDCYKITKLPEVREHTVQSIKTYLDEMKRIEKKEAKKAGAGNPLLQLLTGGIQAEDADEEEADLGVGPDEEYALPKKLLLSRMGLDESNKINLKLSLELETPESKKREQDKAEAEEEPEQKKARKTRSSTKKDAEEIEEKSTSKKNEEPEEDDEDEELPIIQSHPLIVKLSTELRSHIDEIVDWCTTIRAWLQSNISRNKNIGGADLRGDIQQETMAELMGVEQEFNAHKETMAAYYVARAGVLEKYVKSPEFEDYKNFIIDEDEKQFVALRAVVLTLRNQTINLYDALVKDADQLFTNSSSKNDTYATFSMY